MKLALSLKKDQKTAIFGVAVFHAAVSHAAVTLFILAALIASRSQATEYSELKTLVIARGGFGSGDNSINPSPATNSSANAAAIYKSLEVKPEADGSKIIGLIANGVLFGITCNKPVKGSGSCDFNSLVNQTPPEEMFGITPIGNLQLPPLLAEVIWDKLNVKVSTDKTGVQTKVVGNLNCEISVENVVLCYLVNVSMRKLVVSSIKSEAVRKFLKEEAITLGLPTNNYL